MKDVRRFRDRLEADLKEPKFKKAFDEADFYVCLAVRIAKLREEQGLSQQELAKRLHTSQQMVSRLESADNRSFSLRTLMKLARTFHKKLQVDFI